MNRTELQSTVLLATLLLAVLCSGCGSRPEYMETDVFPASGELKIDGLPASGAFVLFHPVGDVGMTKGNKPFARVAADGSFLVTTYNTGDGAPDGNYRVTVIWPEDPDARGPSPDRLRGRYSQPETSGLRAEMAAPRTVLPVWELSSGR